MEELVAQYKYPLICGALGLLLAILILTIGILKTLLLIIFTAIGLYLGFYLQSIGFFEQFRSKNSKK